MSTATLHTNKGDIIVELFDADAPGTVANFTKLINEKFYDGIKFHRVVPNFVIQAGCPFSKTGPEHRVGTGGPGWKIKCETAGNPRLHGSDGVLSMAHAGPNTGGSQFFITLRDTPHLDGVHTVFGRVTDGLDIVHQIAQGDEITSATVAE